MTFEITKKLTELLRDSLKGKNLIPANNMESVLEYCEIYKGKGFLTEYEDRTDLEEMVLSNNDDPSSFGTLHFLLDADSETYVAVVHWMNAVEDSVLIDLDGGLSNQDLIDAYNNSKYNGWNPDLEEVIFNRIKRSGYEDVRNIREAIRKLSVKA